MEAAGNFLHSFKKTRRFWRRTAEPNLRFFVNGTYHFFAFFLILFQAIYRFLALKVRHSLGSWGYTKAEVEAVKQDMIDHDLAMAEKVRRRQQRTKPGDAWGPTAPTDVAQPDFARVGGKRK